MGVCNSHAKIGGGCYMDMETIKNWGQVLTRDNTVHVCSAVCRHIGFLLSALRQMINIVLCKHKQVSSPSVARRA